MKSISRYCEFLTLYTLIVILWGAWVRISRSGDGCGESWPLCHGEVIPTGHSLPTWIEFSHRLSSGLYGFLIIGLVYFAYRVFPKKHAARKMSWVVLFLTITEALIGAGLVLKGLVGDNASVARAYAMGLHMLNSLLLVGSLVVTHQVMRQPKSWELPRIRKVTLSLLTFGFAFICSTGAIAALAGTLFPADSLYEGLLQDLSSKSHILVKLRIWHPISASCIGLALLFFAMSLYFDSSQAWKKKRARNLVAIIFVAIGFGFATLFSLSPVWMKLGHLLLAHTLWIQLVLLLQPVFWASGKTL